MELSKRALEVLEANGSTIESIVTPSQRHVADELQDYIDDAILMFNDFPEDTKAYLEIIQYIIWYRPKNYTSTLTNKD